MLNTNATTDRQRNDNLGRSGKQASNMSNVYVHKIISVPNGPLVADLLQQPSEALNPKPSQSVLSLGPPPPSDTGQILTFPKPDTEPFWDCSLHEPLLDGKLRKVAQHSGALIYIIYIHTNMLGSWVWKLSIKSSQLEKLPCLP